MKRLVFRKDLYTGEAVDAAVKAFAGHCEATLSETAEAWCVAVTSQGGVDETELADELSNYALGLTVENRGASTT